MNEEQDACEVQTSTVSREPSSNTDNANPPSSPQHLISSLRMQPIFTSNMHLITGKVVKAQGSKFCLRYHHDKPLGMHFNSYPDDVVYFTPDTVSQTVKTSF